jgi:hypothetical protein
MDGIYYDGELSSEFKCSAQTHHNDLSRTTMTSHAPLLISGINFDRRSMRRVRKVLESAVAGRAGTSVPVVKPLIDIHTGDNGAGGPSVLRYLSHFAYADTAWNGEGFNWALGPVYYLVSVSGLIHGISADRLGGNQISEFKVLLFGMTTRNSAVARAVWSLWDQANIAATGVAMHGWWMINSPVTLALAPTPSPPTPPPTPKSSCEAFMNHSRTINSFPQACGGAGGAIGFGCVGCGVGHPSTYPALAPAEAQKICCELKSANGTCAGFSISQKVDSQGKSCGCFKKNADCGVVKQSGYDGYATQPPAPTPPGQQCAVGSTSGGSTDPEGAKSSILATSWVKHGTKGRALIVVGSWCIADANVTVTADWAAMGVTDVSGVHVSVPAVAGVQAAGPAFSAKAPMHVEIKAGQGVILLAEW